MATQTDPPTQPDKARANSVSRIAHNRQSGVVSSTVAKVTRQGVDLLTDEQRRELIAVTAYYLAESRHFEPGYEEEDWLTAESQIGSLGARVC
jgi:hypothetical protein